VIDLFASVQTQWRRDAGGLPTGLDYAGVEAAMRLGDVEKPREMFLRLQVLEHEWIAAIREKNRET
jgi:hypothetical protein